MKNFITMIALSTLLSSNILAISLTENDKTNIAIADAAQSLNADLNEFQNLILSDSLKALGHETEIHHETEITLTEMDKKFPKKSRKDHLALIAATLLSQPKKK